MGKFSGLGECLIRQAGYGTRYTAILAACPTTAENGMPEQLTHHYRLGGLMAAAASLALTACQQPAEPTAAENASISRSLEEVEASQARSDAHVNEVDMTKREKAREEAAK
jgi:hypothetical protein